MKRILLYTVLMSVIAYAAAQSDRNADILSISPVLIEKYKPTFAGDTLVLIQMPFGSDRIFQPEFIERLKGQTVLAVDLVYTKYRLAPDFNQEALNRRRLDKLFGCLPDLKDEEIIEWRLVEQSGYTGAENKDEFFHGFVITIRPELTVEKRKEEINYVTSVIASLDSVKPEKDSLLYFTRQVWDKRIGFVGDSATAVYSNRKNSNNPAFFIDSTIDGAFARNPGWEKMLIVTDVTGSMSQFISQVITWYKFNYSKRNIIQFSFFNDGDNKKTELKKIGSTGGIYHIKPVIFQDVTRTMMTAMNNGGGGEAPESDIEALLKGIQNCPECEDIILIADNYSPIRDDILIPKIKKPVHIILCCSQKIIREDYLNLARATGGTLHTVYGDYNDLSEKKEGDQIRINGAVYRLSKGKFCFIGTR
ncbi:MAG: hypothetical protein ABIJ16_07565 [Bacteroidota bacterium]